MVAPLVARDKKTGRYMILGLISAGQGECGSGISNLLTRVSYYRNWIEENMA